MSAPFLRHVQTSDGTTFKNGSLAVQLYTEDMPFDKVQVRYEPDNEEYLSDMTLTGKAGRLLIWEGTFPVNRDRELTHYVFKVVSGNRQFWLDARGVQKRIPAREFHFKFNSVNRPPEWVSEQVFYQIFPDRFSNGNPDISVKSGEYRIRNGTREVVAREWGEEVGDYRKTASIEFYGGDLKGMENKLDYLQNLGVTALYLNPIFTSDSNHKYDTRDYLNVDPHLGSNGDFATLSESVHERGMKLILDAVFNHTSEEHFWFDKSGLTDNGAYHHADSPYRDYYLFDGKSRDYVCWKGVETLPVLNYRNKEVREYIYQSDSSVVRHWLKEPYRIDGWRFDVIHMLGEGEGASNNAHYVREFRKAAKAENAQAYVLGEHFFEATQWLQGDQEDGAMNYYGFSHPVRALLAGKDISYDPVDLSFSEFREWVLEAIAKIPWQNQLAQLNQLDSHDTTRFLNLVEGDERKMRMAAAILFTFPGTPCLYYGTEVGLEGGQDPDNRRCFPWERVAESEWIPFYRKLIHTRKSRLEWQKGSFDVLLSSEHVLVYARTLGCDISVVVLTEHATEVTVPVWKLGIESGRAKNSQLSEEFEISTGNLVLTLAEWGHTILTIESDNQVS